MHAAGALSSTYTKTLISLQNTFTGNSTVNLPASQEEKSLFPFPGLNLQDRV